MESQFFIFDGIKSKDMNLQIMRIEHKGFVDTPFFGGANIHESQSRKRVTPHFYGVTREPIEFTVEFVLVDKYGQAKTWTPQERNRIAKWLIKDRYSEFITSDDFGKRYYAIAISNTDLKLINTSGYIEVTFRTNSPYAWSPLYRQEFDLSSNNTSTIIEIENKSNVKKHYTPLIRIRMEGSTQVELKNLTYLGKTMKFTNLLADEIIEIDGVNRIVTSNKMGQNPFKYFNVGSDRFWMDLLQGKNRIEVKGKCKIEFIMQFPITQ